MLTLSVKLKIVHLISMISLYSLVIGTTNVTNCSYKEDGMECQCNTKSETFSCWRVNVSTALTRAVKHLLNETHRFYWNKLEIECDSPSDALNEGTCYQMGGGGYAWKEDAPYISSEMLRSGPQYRSVTIVGDCSMEYRRHRSGGYCWPR